MLFIKFHKLEFITLTRNVPVVGKIALPMLWEIFNKFLDIQTQLYNMQTTIIDFTLCLLIYLNNV